MKKTTKKLTVSRPIQSRPQQAIVAAYLVLREYNWCVSGRNCPLCKEPLPQGLVGFPLCPACQETVLKRAEGNRDREIVPGHLTTGELVDAVRGFMDRLKPPN